jgi:glycosyltransferase involved in cell wall biosynthesis
MSTSILFFASDFKIGLSSLLTDQLISLSSQGDLKIYALAGEKEQEEGLSQKLKINNIYINRIAGLDDHSDFIRLSSLIADIIIESEICLIHVQNNWQLALITYAKYFKIIKKKKIKIIYTLHGFRHNNKIKSMIARIVIGSLLYLFADTIIYMSDYVRKKFRLVSYKMVKIYLGVDQGFFSKTQNEIDLSKLKLIFSAQFRHGKNQRFLVEVFAEYCKEQNDKQSELYLPGEGKYKKQCQELAAEKDISNQIFFPGLLSKNEIRSLYDSCNIGIIPSNSETYGQCIVEPFVLGRCIITKKVGVAPDILKDGENGLFFNNKQDLKKIFINLSNNRRIIKIIGQNNFNNREIFSWHNFNIKYLELVKNIIDEF